MIKWTDSIPIGTNLKTVRNDQPDFMKIDWNNPDTIEKGLIRYHIIEIKGNKDILKMDYFLEFKNNGYRGLFGHK